MPKLDGAADVGIGNYIRLNPVRPGVSIHPVVLRRSMITKFYADTAAFFLWDQYNSTRDSLTFLFSKDVRIMEKQNGNWKIINVSRFWDYSNKAIPILQLINKLVAYASQNISSWYALHWIYARLQKLLATQENIPEFWSAAEKVARSFEIMQ